MANQRAALEWCWSTAIKAYTAVRLHPIGLQVYERVGISLVEVYKSGREICHFGR